MRKLTLCMLLAGCGGTVAEAVDSGGANPSKDPGAEDAGLGAELDAGTVDGGWDVDAGGDAWDLDAGCCANCNDSYTTTLNAIDATAYACDSFCRVCSDGGEPAVDTGRCLDAGIWIVDGGDSTYCALMCLGQEDQAVHVAFSARMACSLVCTDNASSECW